MNYYKAEKKIGSARQDRGGGQGEWFESEHLEMAPLVRWHLRKLIEKQENSGSIREEVQGEVTASAKVLEEEGA